MVRHPEVYRKVQEELDRVVGNERLPDFDDRDALPYLNAVIKEVYRYVFARHPFGAVLTFVSLDGTCQFQVVSLSVTCC